MNRCEVGTTHWVQCNDTPVKFARFPVTGLVEGRSYIFRVRAVNKTGISHPSRVSEPVAAMDPADRARMRGTIPRGSSFTMSVVKKNFGKRAKFIEIHDLIKVKHAEKKENYS